MKRKQQLYFDGIEKSLIFVELSYQRLIDGLTDDSRDLHSRMPAVLLDCWVIIDLSKRLRALLQHTPGLKQNAVLKAFLAQTACILEFATHFPHTGQDAGNRRVLLGES